MVEDAGVRQLLERRRAGAVAWNRLGRDLELAWLPAASLLRDPDYQRAIRRERVAAISRKFHEDGLGVLIVSLREDGSHYIIDGQHRHESILALGLGHKTVPCVVLRDLAKSDERRIFLLLNKERLPLSHREAFEARAAQGENLASSLAGLLALHGLRLVGGKASLGAREIGSVTVLERIDRQYGEEMTGRVLATIEAGWGELPAAFRSAYLLAAAATLADPAVRDERLAIGLAGCPPEELDRLVVERVQRPNYRGHGQYATVMRELHDRIAE